MARPGGGLRSAVRTTDGRRSSRQSRRAGGSSRTRSLLVEEATRLFAERGYAGTSLDEVVARAEVTKGALYHHFPGKQALFEAVFEQVEATAIAAISERIEGVDDPWQRAREGLRGFLEICTQPTYWRIVMQEGPVALGFDGWRDAERRSSYRLVADIVTGLLAGRTGGGDGLDEGLAATFTTVFFGALRSAGIAVAESTDPERTSRDVEQVIATVLAGLRQVAEAGRTG